MPKRRAIIYIDGFNFYYGAIKDTPYKWLDLELFANRLRNDEEIVAVRYFTAEMRGLSGKRQKVFLDAMRAKPLVSIELGSFKEIEIDCKAMACLHDGARNFPRLSEKRTDVNIALRMVEDALEDKCDTLVLISADSDLVPAVKMVHAKTKKRVVIYLPCREGGEDAALRRADELRQASVNSKAVPASVLKHSLLPNPFIDANGTKHVKPDTW